MKISGSQVIWLIVTCQVGNTILMTIGPAIAYTKQDTWISMLIGGVLGLCMMYVVVKSSSYHTDQTLVEMSQTLFGKWIGRGIVVTYFVLWYSLTSVILRQTGDFTIIALFRVTPLWLVMLVLILLTVYITRQTGIEGIGRFSEIVGPIILIVLLIVMAFSVPNMNFKNILPIYVDSGLSKIGYGVIAPASFFCEPFMMMLIPFMKVPGKALSSTMWGLGVAVSFVSVGTLVVILVFGPNLAGILARPFFDATRFIRIMDFIQNMDTLFILVWILSMFVKLSMYFFITCYGTAQFLKLHNWRRTILPIAVIVYVLAILPRNMTSWSEIYLKKYWLTYGFGLNFITLPLLFFFVATFRYRRNKRRETDR